MAAQPASCVLLATRFSCRRCPSRTFIERPSSRCPAHLKRFASAPFSTSQTSTEFTAAPPIDLEKLERRPARIVPASPSYFSGMPLFTDDLLEARTVLREYSYLPTLPPIEAKRRGWIGLGVYRGRTGELAPSAKYAKILSILKQLNRIKPDLMPRKVKTLLEKYMSGNDPGSGRASPQTLDEDGKASGIGRRKAASAKVYLVEGEGEVLVNGRNVLQVFPRLHDRESAIWPLKVTNRMDKYNVWALVTGGGVTGQAEAITLGLARALMVHEPMLKSVLRKAGCVTRDPRRVERKKHGHVKARKMRQWVKR